MEYIPSLQTIPSDLVRMIASHLDAKGLDMALSYCYYAAFRSTCKKVQSSLFLPRKQYDRVGESELARIKRESCYFVASIGKLSLLQWVYNQGASLRDACNAAARNGHLETLWWAHDAGGRLGPSTASAAASGGHLQILQWLYQKGCPWNHNTYAQAAVWGRLNIVQWLCTVPSAPWNNATLCKYASVSGNLKLIQWLRNDMGCDWHEEVCCHAATGGLPETVPPSDMRITSPREAVTEDQSIENLKWLRDNGCPWDETTCVAAARTGRLKVLQWARAHGCRWCKSACWHAATEGHLDVLKWLRANGCPWSARACRRAARLMWEMHAAEESEIQRVRRREVFDWIVENSPSDTAVNKV